MNVARLSRQGWGVGSGGGPGPGDRSCPTLQVQDSRGLLWGWADVASEGLMRSGTLASGMWTGPCARTPT